MKENQTKSIAMQWLIPTGVLMLVLVVMMFNFLTKSKAGATDAVEGNLISLAEQSADQFADQLTLLEKVGKPIAELLSETTDRAEATELIQVAMKHSEAYMVYACDASGKGISSDGTEISIAGASYFEDVKATEEVGYIYAVNDGTQTHSSVIVSIPIDCPSETGYLLLFYPLMNFESVVKNGDNITWSSATLIDREGNIIVEAGTENSFGQGADLFEELGSDSDTVKTLKSKIRSRKSDITSVRIGNREQALIHVPMSMNEWTLVVGISQASVDRQIIRQWDTTKTMLYQLIIVIFIFACVIVVINIISKVRSNERKKQLEEKADTDLLTGLNNKLATERKIKEFMMQNPDAQSMMFILDIDNFKKINDTMGHAFGDEVLRSLGQQIGAIFRATDIVGRAGGDEFIIFLKNLTETEAIRKEAKKVENFFKDFKAGEYVKYSATASIGVAIFPQEGADFETLYKAADQALYKAKKRGKNQLAFYKDEWAETKPE